MVVNIMKNHIIASVNLTPHFHILPQRPYGVEELIIHTREQVTTCSIMGGCHSKILNALLNGNRLVIKVSHLYRCFSNDKESYRLFWRYLTAGVEWR